MPSPTGTYYVVGDNGCKGFDTTKITTLLPLPTVFLPIDTSVCSITSPGLYWVQATDNNNCKERDSIVANPKECVTGLVPSASAPNNDGKNDKFRPLVVWQCEAIRFIIYNRWGQLFFKRKRLAKAGTQHLQA
jgi:hypothetical protein